MCYQVVERYAMCRCLYHRHSVDPCNAYGQRGHGIQEKTVVVGYACSRHSVKEVTHAIPIGERQLDSAGKVLTGPIHSEAVDQEPVLDITRSDVGLEAESDSRSVSSNESSALFSVESLVSRSSCSLQSFQKSCEATNAAEELADILYCHEIVGPLLQMSFEQDAYTFPDVLVELLQQYSRELRTEVSNTLEQGICRLIRSVAPEISRMLQGRLGYPLPILFDQKRKQKFQVEAALSKLSGIEEGTKEIVQDERDVDEEGWDEFPTLSNAQNFILEAKAFRKLRRNLELYLVGVKKRETSVADVNKTSDADIVNKESDPDRDRSNSIAEALRRITSTRTFGFLLRQLGLSETPSGPGKYRARWQCSCGTVLYDDYQEFIPGSAAAFTGRLIASHSQPGGKSGREHGTTNITRSLSSLSTIFGSILGTSRSSASGDLPLTTARTLHTSSAIRQQSRSQYLLTCLKLATAPTLVQDDLSALESDREFFSFLRNLRGRTRSRLRSLLTFTKVIHIKFVHFELLAHDLVNVLAEDCPPFDSGYMPVKDSFNIFPPIGSNIMVHLYENPSHADTSKFLVGRIPKKLDTKLQICQTNRFSRGWGLELVEGLNWRKIWPVGLAYLILSALIGIVWSIRRHDVQGGFAITACVMTFLPFFTGTLHVAYGPG